MTKKQLKFCIIGTGVGASFIARAAKELEKEGLLTLTAVAGKGIESAKDFAKQYNIRKPYGNYMDMLREEEPDVVAISTPHYLHFSMAIDAMEYGANVLVDKPMAMNLHEADEMIRRAEKYGVKLGVILEYRFDKSINFIKRLVDEGKLGKLILGEAIVEWYRPPEYYGKSPWRGRWATEGGGALINQAIHTIDLLLWIMGRPKYLWAQIDTVRHNIEVEDLAVATIRFENGALGVIQASTAIYPGMPTRLEIHGLNGTAIWEGERIKMIKLLEGEVEIPKEIMPEKSKAWERPEAVPIDKHIALIRDFVMAVIESRKPKVDGYEGRRSLEVIRAIYKASKEQKLITFPYEE